MNFSFFLIYNYKFMQINIPDDEFILELLPEFVDTWIEDIDQKYGIYVQDRDKDELYRLAHTLKGSCYQFGLDEIAKMGIDIMGYANEENWSKAQEMEPVLVRSFKEIKDYLIEKGIMK